MKVVLFCGGFGLRMREFSESVPKPMVPIGVRPILWHIMKYYAHFGHREFILCLGWKAHIIKEFFLDYEECVSNDFVMSAGGDSIKLLSKDIEDWTITFVDTGSHSCIGERLQAVEHLLEGEQYFLANYTDGLSDVPLPDVIDAHKRKDAIATFVSVKPTYSYHAIEADDNGAVHSVTPIDKRNIWMNGGFFVLSREIFRYMLPGEELVAEPFARLIRENRLFTYKHDGFWGCMDTYKEKQSLDDMHAHDDTPWAVWKTSKKPELVRPANGRQRAFPR
ncbi:MAG: sugar phosphate nucleotidyltransferase [Planctomycetota bacterium]